PARRRVACGLPGRARYAGCYLPRFRTLGLEHTADAPRLRRVARVRPLRDRDALAAHRRGHRDARPFSLVRRAAHRPRRGATLRCAPGYLAVALLVQPHGAAVRADTLPRL